MPTRALLTAVHMHDERIGFAVGHDAVILRTGDGGESWRLVHYAPEEERPLLDVWFRDERTGFAVGAYGYFLSTGNGGDTWTSRAVSEDDFHLNALVPAGPDRLFLAAEGGVAYRSDDGGGHVARAVPPLRWFVVRRPRARRGSAAAARASGPPVPLRGRGGELDAGGHRDQRDPDRRPPCRFRTGADHRPRRDPPHQPGRAGAACRSGSSPRARGSRPHSRSPTAACCCSASSASGACPGSSSARRCPPHSRSPPPARGRALAGRCPALRPGRQRRKPDPARPGVAAFAPPIRGTSRRSRRAGARVRAQARRTMRRFDSAPVGFGAPTRTRTRSSAFPAAHPPRTSGSGRRSPGAPSA